MRALIQRLPRTMLAGLLVVGAHAQSAAQERTVVVVTAELPHAVPSRLELEVCRSIEVALKGLDADLRAACGEGRVCVRAECALARADASSAVAARLRDVVLPAAATLRVEAEPGPVAFRVVVGGAATLADVSAAATALARRIERAPAVDAVEVDGMAPTRALVVLDAERVRARDLDPGAIAVAVRDALAAAACKDLDALGALLVAPDVRLRDVAQLHLDASAATQVRAGDGAAVVLTVRVRLGQSSEPARAALAEGKRELPAHLHATPLPDDAVAVEVTGAERVAEAVFALAGRLAAHAGVEDVVAIAGSRDPDLGVAMPERGTLWVTGRRAEIESALMATAPPGLNWRIGGERFLGLVEVRAEGREQVANAATALRAEIADIPGVATVSLSALPERAGVAIDPDPERLAAVGLTPQTFARALELLGSGSALGKLADGTPVTVRVGPPRDDWWQDATVRTRDGWRPLPALAAVVAQASPVVLHRAEGQPATWLIVDAAAGADHAALRARLQTWCTADRTGVVLRWRASRVTAPGVTAPGVTVPRGPGGR